MGAVAEWQLDKLVNCWDCRKGQNGMGCCPIYKKWGACEFGEPLTPQKPPVASRYPAQSRLKPTGHQDSACPICGKDAAHMRSGVHCPQARVVVCMDHCYKCEYLNDSISATHCDYLYRNRGGRF